MARPATFFEAAANFAMRTGQQVVKRALGQAGESLAEDIEAAAVDVAKRAQKLKARIKEEMGGGRE